MLARKRPQGHEALDPDQILQAYMARLEEREEGG
jgi:hypothetical protein